jgi:hypothetical protein
VTLFKCLLCVCGGGGGENLLQRSRASTIHCKFPKAGPCRQTGRNGERNDQLLHDLLIMYI